MGSFPAQRPIETPPDFLRIIHVVSGLEIAHGGPSYSVPRLKDALFAAGFDTTVFADLTPGDRANDSSDKIRRFVRNYGRTPLLRKLHLSKELARHLNDPSFHFDLLHSHGLWRMPNIYAARAARARRIPHVISPRGMLMRVARDYSKAGKWFFWHSLQKNAINASACLHATSLAEYREMREFGIRNPIAIIPNGVDLPALSPLYNTRPRVGVHRARTLLYVGRLHPKKGIDQLLIAWSLLAGEFPDWNLRIIGPSEAEHTAVLSRLAAKSPRVSIEPPIFGEAKWRAFAEADLFILPSFTENFGITVAESLACGRPVITTKGTPWEGVVAQKCGWWIDVGAASIETCLRSVLEMPVETLDEMGSRGAAWVRRAFSWDRIGEEMGAVYRWLCFGAAKPRWVFLT